MRPTTNPTRNRARTRATMLARRPWPMPGCWARCACWAAPHPKWSPPTGPPAASCSGSAFLSESWVIVSASELRRSGWESNRASGPLRARPSTWTCPRCGWWTCVRSCGPATARCSAAPYRPPWPKRRRPSRCPNCSSQRIRQFGAGTQRIQAEVERMFPAARTIRWDRDTTREKGAHTAILAHFASQRADLLIGTQMVAKGLDLPLVTLVGVISADVGLNLPDFRAAERTFQVLTQVAGRAGRGLLGGHVVLQTFQPEHYAIRAAAAHDYQAFYDQELALRRSLDYPPFRRLVKFTYQHRTQEVAQAEAERLAGLLRARLDDQQADLIGPVPSFYARLRGEYRWMVVLRGLPSQAPRWLSAGSTGGWAGSRWRDRKPRPPRPASAR